MILERADKQISLASLFLCCKQFLIQSVSIRISSIASSLNQLTLGILFTLVIIATFPQSGFAQDNSSRLANAAMNRDIETVSRLIQEGVNPDAIGQFGTPALHWLVRVNEISSVELLLAAGANPDLKNHYGLSPLSLAINTGSPVLVAALLSAGADANTNEPTGESALMSAAAIGVLESVNLLLEYGAIADNRDPNFEQSALMIAAREGHNEIVKTLLNAGANPNASTSIGQTPAFIGPNSVPGFGFGVGIIRGGLPADRGRREPTPGGMTPLLYAARHNHTDIAELLLEAGANINQAEANDIQPLLMAISNEQVETALLLIENGAQINISDWYGRSPLWEAVNVRNLYIDNATFVNNVDREAMFGLIQTLLVEGAEANTRTTETPPFRHHLLFITGSLEWVDFTGQTPFLTAAFAGDIKVMRLLLEHGADPHIHTFAGTSALMAAAGVNWTVAQTYTESPESLLEAVKLTWELGLDVNQTNSMGIAAVHGAANRGSNDILRFLVEKGALLDTMFDNENRSPLDWAKGVFLATHPDEPKPESILLITELLTQQGKEIR